MKLLTFSHFKSDPYFNMAFDEWMLHKVLEQKSLICLRLYSWSVGTITFGYNQQVEKAFDNTNLGGTPVIRRVTGGRGLFHDMSELTYSISISSDLIEKKLVSESISKASFDIAQILMSFLNQLNISSDYVKQSNPIEKKADFFHKAPCFESFSRNEIISENKKIIASAQRRIQGSLLQHGSIKINGLVQHDALPMTSAKYMDTKEMKEISETYFMNTLPIFFNSFAEAFHVNLEQGVLLESDTSQLRMREKLVLQKYLEKREFIKHSEESVSL